MPICNIHRRTYCYRPHLEWKTENRNLHRANPLTMAQIGEKPNPNNPIVFFDITVGNTVSSFISSHKILKLA